VDYAFGDDPIYSHRGGSVLSLLSFPTRRSSDLGFGSIAWHGGVHRYGAIDQPRCRNRGWPLARSTREPQSAGAASARAVRRPVRSEEHTSELQSRVDLVCRLLLEKKKKRKADQL